MNNHLNIDKLPKCCGFIFIKKIISLYPFQKKCIEHYEK